MQKKEKNMFVQSLMELKNVRCLAITAMFIALNVAMTLLNLRLIISPSLRISFGFLCNAAIGMLFGPSVGMIAGLCTDLLGYIAGNHVMGPYFPPFALVAMLGGVIWGMWLYPKKNSPQRIIGAKVSINLFCNIILNTYLNSLLSGEAFIAMLPVRVIKNIVLIPLECILLFAVLKLVKRCYQELAVASSTRRNT